MGKLKTAIMLSFRTKVLVPVVAIMVLLIAMSNWLVSRRVTAQLRAGASETLSRDEAMFKNLYRVRRTELEMRYRGLVNEASLKSIVRLADKNTTRGYLHGYIRQNLADVIMLSTPNAAPVTVGDIDREEFETACTEVAEAAMGGEPRVHLVKIGDVLLDVVSVPIIIGDSVDGALTFATKNYVAQEFNQITHSDLILTSKGRIWASTLNSSDLQLIDQHLEKLVSLQREDRPSPNGEIELTDGHFLSLAGSLVDTGERQPIHYVILYSYEKGLQTLRGTQQMMLTVGAFAILLGAVAVWYFIHRVVGPLEQLRDSVEAVGKGDLTRRIEVSSMDECGELAEVFNQMTENIRLSREQLELTVETLKTTQAQLIQSEKLSGIGQFVAGVAHELNNPLTSVMGFSELLQQGDANPQQKRHLEMIYKSALRCQKIVQSLLSFSRRHQPERKLVCVNGLVEAALEILQYQLRTSNIEVTTRLDPRLPQAMVDPHQIQQVFLNIINNARQAIETHRPKGAIRISSDTCGTNVRVIIADDGPGIPQENLSKVFDPFFTTKEVGKGTGLGLSLCYGMVREHGGTIKASSKLGQGATFTVELPIAAPALSHADRPDVPLVSLINPREGSGRKVLVIDDEEPILQMVSEALGRCGYDVDVVSDGETALKRVDQSSYDLALCDWKMPGLSGQQIYERLRVTNPKLSERMIFITGDVVNEKTNEFLQKQNKVCLSKPFSLAEFRNAVNKALVGT